MRMLLIVILILMLLAIPVSASYYHEVQLELDGEWEFNSSFIAPEVNSSIALSGTGKAIMKAVTAARDAPGEWWRLF